MYLEDTVHVRFEDIYDGNRLVRKDIRSRRARVYDLEQHPGFRDRPFWGHNTPYGMQHEFRFMLENQDSYSLTRLNDTTLYGKSCFQIMARLEGKTTMPGFGIKLLENEGSIAETLYIIDKETFYPLEMKGENYHIDNPGQRFFIKQTYCGIVFNPLIDETQYFDTSPGSLSGLEIIEMRPE
jgi:hypothetical protein